MSHELVFAIYRVEDRAIGGADTLKREHQLMRQSNPRQVITTKRDDY